MKSSEWNPYLIGLGAPQKKCRSLTFSHPPPLSKGHLQAKRRGLRMISDIQPPDL